MVIGINQNKRGEQIMIFETYEILQQYYLKLCQENAGFHDFTTEKQFAFINKILANRYKADYKAFIKYEKKKNRKIKKIFNRNKFKFGVISNSLALKMYINEQEHVKRLNKEFERRNFEKKRERLLNRLKIGSKMFSKRTVQGISSSLNEDGAKKEVLCNMHEADVIEQYADEE